MKIVPVNYVIMYSSKILKITWSYDQKYRSKTVSEKYVYYLNYIKNWQNRHCQQMLLAFLKTQPEEENNNIRVLPNPWLVSKPVYQQHGSTFPSLEEDRQRSGP